MTELASGAHLTISRVNRLLRPLRNKCNALAALSKSGMPSRVTYSKQPSNWDPDSLPPLIVLWPSTGIKKLTLDRRSADDFELARRIHAVCDAFKNVVLIAYGHPCNQRIPSFAAICALVVGGNMATANSDCTSIGSGEDAADENDILDVDDIYEAVPPHYRRFLIVSQALSIILCICVHHHTLVTILFDHCLSFGLIYESTHLLNIILAQALLPSSSSYLPPATHPGHINYLLDLHAKWTAGNRLSRTSSSSLLFTTSAFSQVLLGVMSQSSPGNSHILWTSKVLNRLLHIVESCDLDSYINIVHTLSRSFWKTSNSPDAVRDGTQPAMLRDKLAELMSNLFDLLFTQSDSNSSHVTPSRINAVIDILLECHASRLHCSRMSSSGSPIDLPDIIIIFTAHIFVTFRSSIDNSDRLLTILDDSSPIPTTFSKLMTYFSRLQESQAFGDFIEAFLTELRKYSSTLCSERLFGLDASLWACALHHFETNSQKSTSTLVARYKQQLMEAVDAAEHRCFGGDMDSSPIVSFPFRSNRAKRTKRGRLSGHWEWEDMVGSWIRRTPVHKKRKTDDGHLHCRSRPGSIISSKAACGSAFASTPLSTHRRRLPTLSPTSYSQSPEPDGSNYQDETDKENYPSSPLLVVKRSRPIKRRSSNFCSLLADAQTNRIVLHPKAPSSIIPETYVPPFSQESRLAPRKQEQKAGCRKAVPPMPSRTLLLSDDSLDLFTCGTSSPARC